MCSVVCVGTRISKGRLCSVMQSSLTVLCHFMHKPKWLDTYLLQCDVVEAHGSQSVHPILPQSVVHIYVGVDM